MGAGTEDREREPVRRVLGDLLYADRPGSPVSEKDWVALVRGMAGGDQRALHAVYDQIHRIVYTLVVRIVNTRETAEEVTLDVFHDVWRKAATYDPAGGSVVGWVMNQARSRAIDRLRFEGRQKRVRPTAADNPAPASPPDPREAFGVREQARILRDALKVLTPEERRTIETAFFSDMTYLEVATQLNQPLGTVKTRVRSGLGKLRRELGTPENG